MSGPRDETPAAQAMRKARAMDNAKLAAAVEQINWYTGPDVTAILQEAARRLRWGSDR